MQCTNNTSGPWSSSGRRATRTQHQLCCRTSSLWRRHGSSTDWGAVQDTKVSKHCKITKASRVLRCSGGVLVRGVGARPQFPRPYKYVPRSIAGDLPFLHLKLSTGHGSVKLNHWQLYFSSQSCSRDWTVCLRLMKNHLFSKGHLKFKILPINRWDKWYYFENCISESSMALTGLLTLENTVVSYRLEHSELQSWEMPLVCRLPPLDAGSPTCLYPATLATTRKHQLTQSTTDWILHSDAKTDTGAWTQLIKQTRPWILKWKSCTCSRLQSSGVDPSSMCCGQDSSSLWLWLVSPPFQWT